MSGAVRPRKAGPGGLGDQTPGPFSLLSLIQTQARQLARPRDTADAEQFAAQLPPPEAADLYRLPGPQYQSQPADLSLHSDTFEPPHHLFFRPLGAPQAPPPPQYEGYYGEGSGEGAHYGDQYHPTPDTYHDYYGGRGLYTGYEDPAALPPVPRPDPDPARLYEFPALAAAAPHKAELYSDPSLAQCPALLPPPLHPSPAVLLHIKYVMESVCESMCFTDVTIITSTDSLRAHRSILSAHSAFLSYILSTNTEGELQEDPVIFFPHYSSLHVRMLLQFFYTGEVTTMTQRDIEPLRELCFSLGVTSLVTRLDDVKLSISFQNIPSYDTQLLPGEPQDDSKPGEPHLLDTAAHSHPPAPAPPPATALLPAPAPAPPPPRHSQQNIDTDYERHNPPQSVEFKPSSSADDDLQMKTTSCKFLEPREKQKLQPKDSSDDADTRRYTVVSKMPKDTNLQVSVKCSKCDLKFFKKELLNEHLKVHQGIKPKECTICRKTFNTNYHLSTHMRTHTGSKPFSCPFQDCGKEFSDSSSLRRHQQIHSGQKPFKCKICGKAFTDRSSGKRHEKAHNTGTIFSCNICSKSFTRKSQLKKHKKKLHSIIDVGNENVQKTTINECDTCKAVFKTRSKLDQHKKVHTGEKSFKCEKCDKTFARKTNLQLHIRTHTGEKPHACARCGRCFSDVSAFRRHCRTHSGERPYSCGNCDKTFTQASTLYNHKRTCRQRKSLTRDRETSSERFPIKT